MNAKICPRCKRKTDKLIKLDDAEASIQYSELLGIPYPESYYLCIDCAKEYLGITDEDLIELEIKKSRNTCFNINLLKGKIAQVIVETVFLEFGYEVYPYGYESYFTNIIKHLRRESTNLPIRQVRATPDLFVYDRLKNVGYFAEVKASGWSDESNYWLGKYFFDTYKQFWDEAILIVFCIPSKNIYCKPISDIKTSELNVVTSPVTGYKVYEVNLEATFHTISEYFDRVPKEEFSDFMNLIKHELFKF